MYNTYKSKLCYSKQERTDMTLQWLFALCMLAACAYAFPNGAPTQACGDMVPQHGVGAQNGTGGYKLDVTKTSDPEGVKCYHGNRVFGVKNE